jgi:ornithine decarboxylase
MDLSTARIDAFLAAARPVTPCVVVDLAHVRARYHALQAALPAARIYYAVKANPAPPVITALAELGAAFDVASPGEIARCRGLGVAPASLSFGNTIKREADIAAARADGIGLFVADAEAELRKLARAAPGAGVVIRLAVHGGGADWPLTRKFGCDAPTATHLLLLAADLGLHPRGLSFHVGSQQTDPAKWAPPIAHAAEIFRHCARHGVTPDLLNLGGGLPAHYRDPVPPLAAYAAAIEDALARHFGAARPRLLIEPGRYLTGDAGLLRATVLLVAERPHPGGRRWIYLDAGRYHGLAETQGEAIRYRLRTSRDGAAVAPAILAGPTCDSTDIIYERHSPDLPVDLAEGDSVDFLSAGAYTASYAAVEFNGFPPLATHCI